MKKQNLFRVTKFNKRHVIRLHPKGFLDKVKVSGGSVASYITFQSLHSMLCFALTLISTTDFLIQILLRSIKSDSLGLET